MINQSFSCLWALECRLCNCSHRTDANTMIVCPRINSHLNELMEFFGDHLPNQLNHRFLFQVRNQNEDLSSIDLCVPMCVADIVQFYAQMMNNNSDHDKNLTDKSDKSMDKQDQRISDRSIWDQRDWSLNASGGMFVFDAIRIVQTIGCTTENNYQQYSKWIEQSASANERQHPANDYDLAHDVDTTTGVDKVDNIAHDVIHDTTIDIDVDNHDIAPIIPTQYLEQESGPIFTSYGLKIALVYLGPCILQLPCYRKSGFFWRHPSICSNNSSACSLSSSFMSSMSSTSVSDNTRTMLLNHSVIVTGFTKDGFIIRNSWGWQWARQGYGKITEIDYNLYHQLCVYFLSKSSLERMYALRNRTQIN